MPDSTDSDRRGFRTTRWSLIARSGQRDAVGQRALEELCELYWPAVYAFYRHDGADPEAAKDLTQGLLLDLLERDGFASADADRGRFRSYLRVCARNFAANARAREQAQKRGGAMPTLSLDFGQEEQGLQTEPVDGLDADAVFERRWARAVIDAALAALEAEETESGRGRLFAVLRPTLEGESLGRPYAEVAAELGISEGAFKVTAHRLRARFRSRLLAEVGQTVADGSTAELEDEVRQLLTALQAGR